MECAQLLFGSSKQCELAVFKFPNKEKYPELRAKWVRWVNRLTVENSESSSAHQSCDNVLERRASRQGSIRDQ